MRVFRKRHPSVFLFLACYLLCLLLVFLVHFGQFLYNRALYSKGTLVPATLGVEDFELREMEYADGALLTTGSDPQMILKDEALRVDTLWVDFTYSKPPLVQAAFYAAPEEPYSLRRMVYARQQGAGQLYLLPAGGGQSLRLDPDSALGNYIRVENIRINEKRPFGAFFLPSAGEAALLAVGPGLLACGLSLMGQGLRRQGKKGGGETG